MQAGEFRAVMVAQRRRWTGNRQVRGALSQTVEYWDKDGNKVARVHQYRKRDRTIGGSGKPGPKVLAHEGILYILNAGEDWDLPS